MDLRDARTDPRTDPRDLRDPRDTRDRPRPTPRSHHHRGRNRTNPKQPRRYSSSDGEDACAGCPECRGGRNTLPARTMPLPVAMHDGSGEMHASSQGGGRLGNCKWLLASSVYSNTLYRCLTT